MFEMPAYLLWGGAVAFFLLTALMFFDFITATEAIIDTLADWWKRVFKRK